MQLSTFLPIQSISNGKFVLHYPTENLPNPNISTAHSDAVPGFPSKRMTHQHRRQRHRHLSALPANQPRPPPFRRYLARSCSPSPGRAKGRNQGPLARSLAARCLVRTEPPGKGGPLKLRNNNKQLRREQVRLQHDQDRPPRGGRRRRGRHR